MSDVNFNRVNPMHKVPSQRDEDKDGSKKKKKEEEQKKEQNKEKEKEKEKDLFTKSEEVKKDASNPGYTMDWVHLQKIKKGIDPDSSKDIKKKKK